jgi:hypothetical protein
MKAVIDKSLEDYIRSGNTTTDALMSERGELVNAVVANYDFFATVLWTDVKGLNPFVMLLSMNAFMLHTAAVRTVLSGHPVAALPQFRTALESASYAYLISKDASLEEVWLNRNRDEAAHKACRKAFQSAVRDTADMLDTMQEGNGQIVRDGYDAAIDFGAHPNRRGILDHLETSESEDSYLISLIGLYSADALEVQRMLMACLDYGVAIGLILGNCLPEPSSEIQEALSNMNEMKEKLARELFAS